MKPRFRVWTGTEMVCPADSDRYWLDFYRAGEEWTLCESDRETGRWVTAKASDITLQLMQSTGLTDAEGNEVWEGDVLRDPSLNTPVVVEWDDDAARWMAVGVKYSRDLHFHTDVATVIGNRYEHPELMEEVSA